jgi:hypothetical protein
LICIRSLYLYTKLGDILQIYEHDFNQRELTR